MVSNAGALPPTGLLARSYSEGSLKAASGHPTFISRSAGTSFVSSSPIEIRGKISRGHSASASQPSSLSTSPYSQAGSISSAASTVESVVGVSSQVFDDISMTSNSDRGSCGSSGACSDNDSRSRECGNSPDSSPTNSRPHSASHSKSPGRPSSPSLGERVARSLEGSPITLTQATVDSVGLKTPPSPGGKSLQQRNRRTTAEQFELRRKNHYEAHDFFAKFPAGELHGHFEGTVWAEDYVDGLQGEVMRTSKEIYLDRRTLMPSKERDKEGTSVQISQLGKNESLLKAFQEALSVEAGDKGQESLTGATRFFEVCDRIEKTRSLIPESELLWYVMRAAREANLVYQELFIELVTKPVEHEWKREFRRLFKAHTNIENADAIQPILESAVERLAAWVEEFVHSYIEKLDTCCQKVGARLSPDNPQPITSLESVVPTRFHIQVMRTLSIPQFFAECLGAIHLQKRDPRVVCLQIVGPECHPKSIKLFQHQLTAVDFLVRKYSTEESPVRVSWHAGEFTRKAMTPAQAKGRIRDSIDKGHATSIGHGVSLDRTYGMNELLKIMKAKGIPVHICLTANAIMLGIEGKDHPFLIYYKNGVPCTFNSDDGGIFREGLTDQFVRASRDFPELNYEDMVKIAMNSITYSYLPGESIWYDDNEYKRLKPGFEGVYDYQVSPDGAFILDWNQSPFVKGFLAKSEKAYMQCRQIRLILQFEHYWAQDHQSGEELTGFDSDFPMDV